MNTFVIALGGGWTLMDATAVGVDPLSDIIRCSNTRQSLKTVMRFKAPGWIEARRVFDWKSSLDRKVPKHVLEWEEVRIMSRQEHRHDQVAQTKG
jgi:hypothetical protein